MADNKFVSIKVCGRPHENSGFNPLVYFNSPLFDVPDTVYSGFNEVSYFFSVIIEKTQVVYTLIMNNVRSYQGFRLGNLKIAMSIPKGYKISNGKSPYDALISIKDYIIGTCMTCKDTVRLIYEFNTGIISPTLLDDFAREFLLERVAGPYHSMSADGPKGYIILPEEQINLLLSDVQYPEFSKYVEIVIAQSVQATNYTQIVNLQVPRKSRFSIILNGVEDGYVENPDEQITVSGEKDDRYYNNYQCSFCISSIRNGGNIPNVKIDEENETISIDTSTLSSPKQVKVSIEFDAEALGYFYTIKEHFHLLYNQRVIPIKEDYTFILIGENIAMLANPEGFVPTISQRDRYIIEGSELIKKDAGEYLLKIKTKKVVKPITVRPQKDPDINRVEVILNERPAGKFFKVYDYDELVQSSRMTFNKSGNSYRSVIYIPSSDSYVLTKLKISYESPEYVYESKITHDKRSDTYTASNFNAQDKTFYERKIKHIPLHIIFITALIIGMLCGGFLGCKLYPSIQTICNKITTITCEYCDKTFSYLEHESHRNTVHLTEECETCGERFRTKEDLKSHKDRKHKVCNVCGECFDSKKELTEHTKSKHGYACDECGEKFVTEGELADHKKTHTSTEVVEERPYRCDKCDAEFASKDELRNHKQNASQYKCKDCGAEFCTTELLVKHREDAHGER